MWTTKIVSVEEFKQILIDTLIYQYKDWTLEESLEDALTHGIPVFDKDEIGKTLHALRGRVFLPSMAVDTGDSMFIWIVSGTDAILVKRNENLSIKA